MRRMSPSHWIDERGVFGRVWRAGLQVASTAEGSGATWRKEFGTANDPWWSVLASTLMQVGDYS
jgi:hypothetical protein